MDDFILSPIEQRIADGLRAGLSNPEIGIVMHRSTGNVKNHIGRMLKKAQVRNRLELALLLDRQTCTCRHVVPRTRLPAPAALPPR